MHENQYIKINISILQDIRLNSNDKIVYGIISNFIKISGSCWASNKIISQKCNISIRTIQRSINKLVKLNILYKSVMTKKSKKYRIITNNLEFSKYVVQNNNKLELFDYNWLEDDESDF